MRHLAQIEGDGFSLTSLFSVDPRVRTGSINERHDGTAELLGNFHDAQRLAVAFGLWHPEIAIQLLLGIPSLLMTDQAHRRVAEKAETADDCSVVSEFAIPVNLDKVRA